MSEFERVSQDMFWAVPLREGDARNKAIDHNLSVHALITAYIADTDRKSGRVGKECLRLCRSRWSPYH